MIDSLQTTTSNLTNNVKKMTDKITQTIRHDKSIQHCRINVVNGSKDIFEQYKKTLSQIHNEYISVRFYENYGCLHRDLFIQSDFMHPRWFNVFVINIGIEEETLRDDVCGVEIITKILQHKLDSQYYSTLIIAPIPIAELKNLYKKVTGRYYPINNHRCLGYELDSNKILSYLNQIVHTHSTQFLSRWEKALSNLENFQKEEFVSVARA